MLIGERLASGFALYQESHTNLGPISALIYAGTDSLFGRSVLAYQVLSILLITYQSFLFNEALIENRAFKENSYIPAFLYAIIAAYFCDYAFLSPELMSMTFVLMALKRVFSHLNVRAKRDETILNVGLQLGIATLFFLPNAIFLSATLLTLLLFSSTIPRRFALLCYGYFLVLILVALYFFLAGGLGDFLRDFFASWFAYSRSSLFSTNNTLILLIPILWLSLVAIVRVLRSRRFTTYQGKLQQVMLLLLLFGIAIWFASPTKGPFNFIFITAPLAFFLSHFLLLLRSNATAEALFFLFFIIITGSRYIIFIIPSEIQDVVSVEQVFISKTQINDSGKKLLVLGNTDISVYSDNQPATPYFDWSSSKEYLNKELKLTDLNEVYKDFKKDSPEVIIDSANVVPILFDRMPILSDKYQRKSQTRYVLKEKR